MLKCDMHTECEEPVTHIDDKGYVYCEVHGEERKAYRRCRKLRVAEVIKLERGETTRY